MSDSPEPPEPDPPSPIVQIERELDELRETVDELTKHGPLPNRLWRTLEPLIAEAKRDIIAMRVWSPARKLVFLYAGMYLIFTRQTGKATEKRHEQSGAELEALIVAIERQSLSLAELRLITIEKLAERLAHDDQNFDETGRPTIALSDTQVGKARRELVRRMREGSPLLRTSKGRKVD
jgi:hypothetical protein